MFGGKSGIALATSFLVLACGTSSVLAQMFAEENWKTFTYNFGAWHDANELAAIVPHTGECSLVLQGGENPKESKMVFPWCKPTFQAPWVQDIKDAGAERVLTHFIHADYGRHKGQLWRDISPDRDWDNLFILEDLEPVGEDGKQVRAKAIVRISQSGSHDAVRVPANVELDDSWPIYPNPQKWGVGQPLGDGTRAYIYTDKREPAPVV